MSNTNTNTIRWNGQTLTIISTITDSGRPNRTGFKCRDEEGNIRFIWN